MQFRDNENTLKNKFFWPFVVTIMGGLVLLFFEYGTNIFGNNTAANFIGQIEVFDVSNLDTSTDSLTHAWNREISNYRSLYCVQKIRLANNSAYPTTIVDYSALVIHENGKVQLNSDGETIITSPVHQDFPFYCVGSYLIQNVDDVLYKYSPPATAQPLPTITAVPEPRLQLPVSNESLSYVPHDICVIDTEMNYPRYVVSQETMSLPIRLESNSILPFYLVTEFSVNHASYFYTPTSLPNYVSVTMQGTFIDIKGQEIQVSETACFYVSKKK